MTTTRFALAAAFALAASTAHAQTRPAVPTTLREAVMPPQSMPEVDAAFAAWDTNHNGSLSLDEFRAGASRATRISMIDRRLHAQFAAVDLDKNDSLDAAEYARLLLVKRVGASAPPLSAFDVNHDQRLNYPEYTDMVRRLAAMPAARAATPPAGTAPATPAAPIPVRK